MLPGGSAGGGASGRGWVSSFRRMGTGCTCVVHDVHKLAIETSGCRCGMACGSAGAKALDGVECALQDASPLGGTTTEWWESIGRGAGD
jgi:hypothetical protein